MCFVGVRVKLSQNLLWATFPSQPLTFYDLLCWDWLHHQTHRPHVPIVANTTSGVSPFPLPFIKSIIWKEPFSVGWVIIKVWFSAFIYLGSWRSLRWPLIPESWTLSPVFWVLSPVFWSLIPMFWSLCSESCVLIPESWVLCPVF